jgi:hypothetical protein
MKQLSRNFNSIYLALTAIYPYGQKCKFCKIQDGGGRHLEFIKMLIVSTNMKHFSPEFNSLYLAPTNINP